MMNKEGKQTNTDKLKVEGKTFWECLQQEADSFGLVRDRDGTPGVNPCENTTGRQTDSAQSIGRTGWFGLHASEGYTLCLCSTFLSHRRDSETGNQIN